MKQRRIPAILALGPSANWPCKQWPVENFIALAQRLTAGDGPLPNARILLTAAPHEREQLGAFIAAFPDEQIINAVGRDLLTVAACLATARLYIGNDSGLMHMAAAMNIPTLGLFGPGYEAVYGPWGEKTAYIRTPGKRRRTIRQTALPGRACAEPDAKLECRKRLSGGDYAYSSEKLNVIPAKAGTTFNFLN